MDFEFSNEQSLLRDSIDRYLRENYDFQRRRAIVASEQAFSAEIWQEAANLGWLGIPFTEEEGGLGGGPVELMLLFEALGRHMVVEPFLESLVLGGGVLRRLNGTDASKPLLRKLISGELQCALAHGGKDFCFPVDRAVSCTASADGEGYRLTGSKAVVYNAGEADLIIVSAVLEGELALFQVPGDAESLEQNVYPTVDGRQAAELELCNVQVPGDALMAIGDRAKAALKGAFDDTLLALAAEEVGMMQALLDDTIAYAGTRRQFGRALSEFQVLQHRLVDMYIALELSRSLLLAAAIKLRDRSDDASRFAAAAKIKADQSAKFVAYAAFQVHGGIATTDELSVGHYLKRITIISHRFGSTTDQVEYYRHL